MNEMKDINSIAMEVIMDAGDGRVKIDEAFAALALGDVEKAEILLREADARGDSESGEWRKYGVFPVVCSCTGYADDHYHRAAYGTEDDSHCIDADEEQ